jgi:hypothetical protein
MSAKMFFYCLKVWLASVLIGPAVFWCYLMVRDSSDGILFSEFLLFWGFSIVVGLGCSLISFLLFWGSTSYLYRHHWKTMRMRIATVLLALVLTLAPFLICFRSFRFFEQERITLFECYLLPILVGIFFYRLPRDAGPDVKTGR